MPHVEGRGIVSPVFTAWTEDRNLVLRVDDAHNKLVWFRLEITPEEWGELSKKLLDWLLATGQLGAADELLRRAA